MATVLLKKVKSQESAAVLKFQGHRQVDSVKAEDGACKGWPGSAEPYRVYTTLHYKISQ